jgi:voltage-gated potassium channel
VLGLGPVSRARALLVRLRQALHADLWFPHVPLALLTLLLGLVKVNKEAALVLATGLAHWVGPESAGAVARGSVSVASRTVLGMSLLIMSVGLLFRSRLAWVMVLALLAGHVALSVRSLQGVGNPIVILNLVLLAALLLARGQFSRSSLAAGTLFAATSVIALVTLAVVGSFELREAF